MDRRAGATTLVSALLVLGLALPAGSAPARRIKVRSRTVPLPAAVHDAQLPWWTRDGSALVMSARSDDFPGMQIVRVRPNGDGFACLTCAISPGDPPLMKPIPLDARRVLVRVGNQTPVANGRHAVLECRPSVLACDRAELVPIEVPTDDNVVQPQREFRAAPDGEHVAFTQFRTDALGDQIFVSVVARLRRAGDHYALDDPRVVSTDGELKDFTADGRGVVIAAFVEGPETANGDDLIVDLRTGRTSRLTWFPDYEEPAEQSPRATTWWAVGSARTARIFEPIARIRRPNLLGQSFAPFTWFAFLRYRDELLEPWLIDARAERRGKVGTLLNRGAAEQGWEGRMIPNWSPDGRRITFWETRTESEAGATDAGTRVVVSTVRHLPRGPRVRRVEVPEADWAPSLAGFVPPTPALPRSHRGRYGGKVVVSATRTGDRLDISIDYRSFSNVRGWVLHGTEQATNVGGPFGSLTYSADIRVTGRHRGRLRVEELRGDVGGFTGVITSRLDGVRMHQDVAEGLVRPG